jgi:hypothetical protein
MLKADRDEMLASWHILFFSNAITYFVRDGSHFVNKSCQILITRRILRSNDLLPHTVYSRSVPLPRSDWRWCSSLTRLYPNALYSPPDDDLDLYEASNVSFLADNNDCLDEKGGHGDKWQALHTKPNSPVIIMPIMTVLGTGEDNPLSKTRFGAEKSFIHYQRFDWLEAAGRDEMKWWYTNWPWKERSSCAE